MKNVFRKVICAVMTLGVTLNAVACGSGTNSENPGDGGSSSKGTINVHYYAGGFGNEELFNALTSDYKALTGVKVNWRPSYSQGEIQQLLTSNQEQYDIVMPLLNIYNAQDSSKLENLDDVYNAVPTGESVAIKDKMNQDMREYLLAEDGHYYQMVANDSVSAFCYNADTLDEAYGEGNWSLPLTTTQLLKMADELKSKNYYAFSTSTATNYYWDYMGVVWWAQYDGLESFNNYFQGKYYDKSTSEWKYGVEINDTEGRKIALDTLSSVMASGNGRMHALAGNMKFTDAQRAFLGRGYVDDKKKVAFMVNGDWLENEMAASLIAVPQNIGMMRTPVVSELATKLSTVRTEDRLVAIITAVDENKTFAETAVDDLADLSEEDFESVREARLMVYTATPNYPIAIPSYRPETKKQLAKDFLVYLYSDRAQRIFAKNLQGLTYPSGYNVLSDSSVEVSDFVKTRLTAFGNDKINVFPRTSSILVYRGGLGCTPGAGASIDNAIFTGSTSTSLLNASRTNLQTNWDNISKYIKNN